MTHRRTPPADRTRGTGADGFARYGSGDPVGPKEDRLVADAKDPAGRAWAGRTGAGYPRPGAILR